MNFFVTEILKRARFSANISFKTVLSKWWLKGVIQI